MIALAVFSAVCTVVGFVGLVGLGGRWSHQQVDLYVRAGLQSHPASYRPPARVDFARWDDPAAVDAEFARIAEAEQ